MVEHVPVGTPIDDPELIQLYRKVPVGKVHQIIKHSNHICVIIVLERKKNFGNEVRNILISYVGVLDEKYSVYVGEWYSNIIITVLDKSITPDTHDVFVDWDETKADGIPFMLFKAFIVVKHLEIMQW